jgi:hypothetical protein
VYETIDPDFHDYHPHPPLKKPVEVVVNPNGGLQQHVHHHYHHGDVGGVVKPAVVVEQSGPLIPTGPVFESGPVYGSASVGPSSPFAGGPIGSGSLYGGGQIGSGSLYGGGPIGSGSLYGGGPIGGSLYGGSGPYLGQSPFYKKELSIKSPLTGEINRFVDAISGLWRLNLRQSTFTTFV